MQQYHLHRILVAGPLRAGAELLLNADRSHYVSRVLRLRRGSELTLFDGGGAEYAAAITDIAKNGVTVMTGEPRQRNIESPLGIHLVQGISRGDRMDHVVQKATELGVRRIAPVTTEFSVVRLDPEKAAKRVQHWTKIAQSSCEQCGRNTVPAIDAPQTLATFLAGARPADGYVLHPDADRKLTALSPSTGEVDLLIGPEGGLSDTEYKQAEAAGFVACSLGPRILRTETAAIAAIAVLQAKWGDLR